MSNTSNTSNKKLYISKWNKLKSVYNIYLKIKYSLDVGLKFIHEFTSHLQFYKLNINLDKTEYLEINNQLNILLNSILCIKKR